MPKGDNAGRKTLIDPEKRATIMECVEIGMPYKYAAHAARVSERVLYDWLERGREDFDAGLTTEFSEFLHDIEQGLAGRLKKHMIRINEGAQVWHSSAWMLERRWRKDFGQDAAMVEELTNRLGKLEALLQKQDDDPLKESVGQHDKS